MQELLDSLTERNPRDPEPEPFRTRLLTIEHIKLIKEFVNERLDTGQITTLSDIQTMLKELDSPTTAAVEVSIRLLNRVLHAIGYVCEERKVKAYTVEQREARFKRIRQFLLAYSAARRDPDTVVAYMDESYCNLHLARNKTWYPVADCGVRLHRRSGKGPRLIIVHALTAEGMMHYDDDTTCEWIFRSNTGQKDYHTNMNGDRFMEWIEEKFIPTFKKLLKICQRES